ncbi:MAG TPA: hypothetical protein VIM71_05980 [Lacunisphaera sp.]
MASAPAAPKPAVVAPESTKPLPPAIEPKPASITGSEESSAMLDSFTAFVTAVDGVPVSAGRQGWNTPLTLKAGPRRLAVAFNRGVFTAHCELPLNVRSESVYQLKFATDAELFGKNSYCEFWIVDAATSQPVTKRTRVSLTKLEAGK